MLLLYVTIFFVGSAASQNALKSAVTCPNEKAINVPNLDISKVCINHVLCGCEKSTFRA